MRALAGLVLAAAGRLDLAREQFARAGNDHPIPESDPYHNNELPQREYDPEKAAFHAKKAGLGPKDVILSASDAAFNGAIDMSVLFQATAAAAGINVTVRREPADGTPAEVRELLGRVRAQLRRLGHRDPAVVDGEDRLRLPDLRRHLFDVGPARVTYGLEWSPARTTLVTEQLALRASAADARLVLPTPGFPVVLFPFGTTERERRARTIERQAVLGYTGADWPLPGDVRVESGLAVRHLSTADGTTTRVDPRVGIAWRPAPHHWLRAAGQRALAHRRTVVAQGSGQLTGLLVVLGRDTLAVHVRGEGDVSQLGELLGAHFHVVAQPPPLMDDEDPRPLAGDRVIVGEMSGEGLTTDLVIDGHGFDFGVCCRLSNDQGGQGYHSLHDAPRDNIDVATTKREGYNPITTEWSDHDENHSR